MGYYCTVPQCTSHNGKTKNVRFHGFPKDKEIALRWNLILKRGKNYTQYSKVCSKHFTPEDYNVTAMGRKKTLNKSALPTQNLPKLNADGTVMSIRKRRTVKYNNKDGFIKNGKRNKMAKCQMPLNLTPHMGAEMAGYTHPHDPHSYRLQTFSSVSNQQPQPSPTLKPLKQDATIQTDSFSEDDTQNTYYPDSEYNGFKSYTDSQENAPKDYTKPDNPFALHNEEEAERYALDRKPNNLASYMQKENFPTKAEPAPYALKETQCLTKYDVYPSKMPEVFDYPKPDYGYSSGYDSVELLKHQQHNIQMLQGKLTGNQNFFSEPHIKQEVTNEEDVYNRTKEQLLGYHPAFTHLQYCVKQEPDCVASQSQGSPYYSPDSPVTSSSYFEAISRPGPESLMAKQNALAAQPQLWPSAGKRPFYYTEHYSTPIYTEDYHRVHQ